MNLDFIKSPQYLDQLHAWWRIYKLTRIPEDDSCAVPCSRSHSMLSEEEVTWEEGNDYKEEDDTYGKLPTI